jgi:drug/metabolite transporter, DME family
MVGAVVLWSLSGLFAKAPLFDEWPEADRGALLAFWRAVFATTVLLPLVRRARFRRGLIPLTLSFAGMNLTYLTAMSLSTAANAIWLQMTAPLWVFLFGLVLFREKIAGREAVPLVFGLAGVGTILLFEFLREAAPQRTGVVCGVASGACYGGVIVMMHRMREENHAWLVAVCHAVTAAILLPVVVRLGVRPSFAQLAVLACFGAFQMALPYIFLMRALRTISGQEAIGIGLIEPLLVPLWVLLAWGEMPDWWTLAGGAMILSGLSVRYFLLERPRGAEPGRQPLLP